MEGLCRIPKGLHHLLEHIFCDGLYMIAGDDLIFFCFIQVLRSGRRGDYVNDPFVIAFERDLDKLIQELPAVHVRHIDVEEDQFGERLGGLLVLLEIIDGFFAVIEL